MLPNVQQINEMKLCLLNKQQSLQEERRSRLGKKGCKDRKCRIISRVYWLLSHHGTETAVVGVDPVTLTEGLDWLQRLGEREDE